MDHGTSAASDGVRPASRERKGRAVVATGSGSAAELLERAANAAGLWERVEAARLRAGVAPSELRIAILPDLSSFDRTGVATTPALVEHLVDLLAQRGFTGATVGAAPEGAGREAGGGLAAAASRAGYRGTTPSGRPYTLADLGEELAPVDFPPGSVLAGASLSRRWTEAHLRIVFARSRTHEEHGYALCLHALLGVLPLRDKLYHYRQRQKPWDLCLDLLQHTPVAFSLIDAWRTADGLGLAAERYQETRTVVAGDDLLLVDWVGAVKMGLDPDVSRVNAHALRALGLPADRQIDGDLAPFAGLRKVHPLVADSFRQARESGEPARLLPGGSAPAPGRAAVAERIAALVSKLAAAAEENPAALAALAGGNFALASVGQWLQAWRTLAAKDELLREEVPLGLDLAQWGPADYEAVEGYLLPLEALIRATPPDENGLRWRYLEGSVLFEYGRVLPVPFDAYAAKVDICQAVQCMKDYLGGRCVPVARDDAGRVVHQAERTRYLPQPNWLVLYGGQPIDVGKLEVVRYRPGEHRIFWRTVRSENGSAEYDDGIVTFAAEAGGTRVTVLARQKFALPPFLEAMKLELFPEVKDALVAQEYHAYFRETLTNFQARYEGQDFRVGRPGRTDDSGADGASEALARAGEAARSAAERLRALLRKVSGTPATPPPEVDGDGFRHFTPAPDEPGVGSRRDRALRDAVAGVMDAGKSARSLLAELGSALRADLGGREE